MLIPVMLHEQIQPGTFEFALDHLVDHELDLSALDARFVRELGPEVQALFTPVLHDKTAGETLTGNGRTYRHRGGDRSRALISASSRLESTTSMGRLDAE